MNAEDFLMLVQSDLQDVLESKKSKMEKGTCSVSFSHNGRMQYEFLKST